MSEVEQVMASAWTIPTDAPEGDGTLLWDSTTVVVVQVRAGGETGTGWTYGPAAVAALVESELAGVVTGGNPMDVPALWAVMVRQTRNATRAGLVGYAVSALDIALHDLKARLLGLPLHRLLGAARPSVPVYGSGGFVTYDDERLTAQLRGWADGQGIPRVKIKIGERWGADEDRDLARIARARQVVGPDVELFVDANGAYGRKQAVRVAHRAAGADVRWFEEPVSSQDLDGLREVRDSVEPDVTAGEYASDVFAARRLCEAGAVDCLQLDASRIGGLGEFQRAAAVAASYGLDVSGHCAPHLHAAVCASVPNLRHLEWFHDHVRIESVLFDGTLDPAGGSITPSDDPGHGLTLRPDRAEKFRVA